MKPEQYFKDYPGKQQCFQTADGLIFHEEGDARLHARGLEYEEVARHEREAEPEPVREGTNQDGEPQPAPTKKKGKKS